VVEEHGDCYRDTVALTIRGDGVDIPPFIIVHTSRTASYASGRKCGEHDEPVKGMNNVLMKAYIDHIAWYVHEPSLLLLDQLSSHKSPATLAYICSKKTSTGEQKFIPLLLPAKTAFLISPLDMGAIGAFKSKYYTLDRSDLDSKIRAVQQAWDSVSNQTLKNICVNCGIVGEESIESLRGRFMKEVGSVIPAGQAEYLDYFDAWKSGAIEVEGATRGRGVALVRPKQLPEGYLDGVYWTNYGGSRLS
jgi:DDE superfamily endonuclease